MVVIFIKAVNKNEHKIDTCIIFYEMQKCLKFNEHNTKQTRKKAKACKIIEIMLDKSYLNFIYCTFFV